MIPDLGNLVSRLGIKRVASLSGVSSKTLTGVLSGAISAGPRVSTSLKNAVGDYKVQLLRAAGASPTTAEVARHLGFKAVDKYVARMTATIDAIARDRAIPGEGFSREEYRAMILEGMEQSGKSVTEMYEKYVG